MSLVPLLVAVLDMFVVAEDDVVSGVVVVVEPTAALTATVEEPSLAVGAIDDEVAGVVEDEELAMGVPEAS